MASNADQNTIKAQVRTEFGKGAARRTRRDGLVPAVLYGHGTDPVHLALPSHEIKLALRVANALLSISVEGEEDRLALPKQIQRNPVRDTIEHVDLVIVRRGEKVTVEVPVIMVGAGKNDLLYLLDRQALPLEVEATQIPSDITIDVSKLEAGDSLTAADLVLPEGATFVGEPEEIVVSVSVAKVAAEESAEAGGEEGAEEAAEATEEG